MIRMKRARTLPAMAVILSGLVAGCGPTEPPVEPIRPEVQMGRDDAQAYLQQRLRLYRLVIRMQPMGRAAQEAYAQGVGEAFAEAGKRQVTDALLEAARSHAFTAAADVGADHATDKVTNARVQSLIGGSLNRGLGAELGCKAGYIEGFRQGAAGERPDADAEALYDEAQAVYDALRASL